ncbi:hypothetical protein F4802DRAFT_199214 [Xylaria palmicola]|nr:hypothetical protein F4802DRAFT_199214 [Xylaria palmicola]
MSGSGPPSFNITWPGDDNNYLSPSYLKLLEERLDMVKSQYRDFLASHEGAAKYNLDYLVGSTIIATFCTMRVIANEVPVFVPEGMDLDELQVMLTSANPPELSYDTSILPNPAWNTVFHGYRMVLEEAVDTFILGDTPSLQVELAAQNAPDPAFTVLRDIVLELHYWPCTRACHRRLMEKLDGSRSGVCFVQQMGSQYLVGSVPAGKRKIDTLGLDEPTKKKLLKTMKEWPELDRVLSDPVE